MIGSVFLVVLTFFGGCMGLCGVMYFISSVMSQKHNYLKAKTSSISNMTISFFTKMYSFFHVKRYKDEVDSIDPLDEWPVLNHYQKMDPLVSSFDDDPESINEVDDLEIQSLKVKALFLGMSDEETVVVYRPSEKEMHEHDNLSDIDETQNPSRVYEESVEKIMGRLVNPAAEVRKRELDGAKSLCKLQNSGYETFRKSKAKERRKLVAKDAQPCDEIEEARRKIEA